MAGIDGDVTLLLNAAEQGDTEALGRVYEIMYSELRRLARSYMRRERADHSLEPTALIHEVYIRLTRGQGIRWQSRSHFAAMAATVMRRVLVDHARSHTAQMRGYGRRIPIDEAVARVTLDDAVRVLGVHEALKELKKDSPRQAQIVELRFFGGLSTDEIAGVLDVTPRTINRDWALARIWLHKRLGLQAGQKQQLGEH
jgi:RNA polymerase sigma factor (TIGR02999 family)